MVNLATVDYHVHINHEASPNSRSQKIIFPLTTPYCDCSATTHTGVKFADV